MNKKTQLIFRIVFGVVLIGGAIFLSFRYLLKGPPFIKVVAIALILGTSYLVIDYLIKKSKQ